MSPRWNVTSQPLMTSNFASSKASTSSSMSLMPKQALPSQESLFSAIRGKQTRLKVPKQQSPGGGSRVRARSMSPPATAATRPARTVDEQRQESKKAKTGWIIQVHLALTRSRFYKAHECSFTQDLAPEQRQIPMPAG